MTRPDSSGASAPARPRGSLESSVLRAYLVSIVLVSALIVVAGGSVAALVVVRRDDANALAVAQTMRIELQELTEADLDGRPELVEDELEEHRSFRRDIVVVRRGRQIAGAQMGQDRERVTRVRRSRWTVLRSRGSRPAIGASATRQHDRALPTTARRHAFRLVERRRAIAGAGRSSAQSRTPTPRPPPLRRRRW